MAITVEEAHRSQSGPSGAGGSVECVYHVLGTATRSEVDAAVLAYAPLTFLGLVRKNSVDAQPLIVDIGNPAGSRWEARVRFLDPAGAGAGTGDAFYNFDATGGVQHITQSIATVGAYGNGAQATDNGGAIGWDGENVNGVDIPVPNFDWTERHILSSILCTWTYRRKVALMRGVVNAASFRGFDRGEVLFLGPAGGFRAYQNDWDVTFRFSASGNVVDQTIGDITGIDKEGWQHLWIYYKNQLVSGRWYKQPYRVYVEQVFYYADFSQLGILTGVPGNW